MKSERMKQAWLGWVEVRMSNAGSLSLEQIRHFLDSSQAIEFTGCGISQKYAWVERVLEAQNYGALGKRQRGVVRAYLEKVTGTSASQMTRLIRRFLDDGAVRAEPYQRHAFPVRHTPADTALLAEVDRVHERLSGPATRYRNQAAVFQPTRPAAIPIGERRRPDPREHPGY